MRRIVSYAVLLLTIDPAGASGAALMMGHSPASSRDLPLNNWKRAIVSSARLDLRPSRRLAATRSATSTAICSPTKSRDFSGSSSRICEKSTGRDWNFYRRRVGPDALAEDRSRVSGARSTGS